MIDDSFVIDLVSLARKVSTNNFGGGSDRYATLSLENAMLGILKRVQECNARVVKLLVLCDALDSAYIKQLFDRMNILRDPALVKCDTVWLSRSATATLQDVIISDFGIEDAGAIRIDFSLQENMVEKFGNLL